MRRLDRVRLIAHELAHVSQTEMRQSGRGAPAVWIREGHADWVRLQVLEFLGMRTYPESRDEVKRFILPSATPIRFFPMLMELSGGAKWTDANIRLGSAATYGQAFLALDWLVERYGIDSLEQFNRRFATDGDPRSHRADVSAIGFSEFVRQFRERLERLGSPE